MCKIPHRQLAGHRCKLIICNGHSVLTRMNDMSIMTFGRYTISGRTSTTLVKRLWCAVSNREHEIEGNNAHTVPIVEWATLKILVWRWKQKLQRWIIDQNCRFVPMSMDWEFCHPCHIQSGNNLFQKRFLQKLCSRNFDVGSCTADCKQNHVRRLFQFSNYQFPIFLHICKRPCLALWLQHVFDWLGGK